MDVSLVLVFTSCLLPALGERPHNGDLRLVGGPNNDSGRVEIYMLWENRVWSTIDADTSLSDQKNIAQTICRQLGYDTSSKYGMVSSLGIDPAESDVPMLIRNVKCDHAYQHIMKCDYDKGDSSPDHQRDFAVQCSYYAKAVVPYETQVRLTQGETGFISSGFLEIYLNRSWGPVCNMNFVNSDSACRQLGYTHSYDNGDSHLYDSTGKNAKVDRFNCVFSQPCLKDCFSDEDTYSAVCTKGYSYVNCTPSIVPLAVSMVFAVLIFIIILIIAFSVLCYCCVRRYRRTRNMTNNIINKQTEDTAG